MKRKPTDEFNSGKRNKVAKSGEVEFATAAGGVAPKVLPSSRHDSATDNTIATAHNPVSITETTASAYGRKKNEKSSSPQHPRTRLAIGDRVLIAHDSHSLFPSERPEIERTVLKGPYDIVKIHSSHVILASTNACASLKLRVVAPHDLLVRYERFQRSLTPNVDVALGSYNVCKVLDQVNVSNGTKYLVGWSESQKPDCWVHFSD
ncbi:hypothetical protein HDU76_003447 [Blyttiomyces sp. JEL0837]|nr:hypothetical protein HDU76_003447 [Blyttiomyces sp. JEL0837]